MKRNIINRLEMISYRFSSFDPIVARWYSLNGGVNYIFTSPATITAREGVRDDENRLYAVTHNLSLFQKWILFAKPLR